MFAQLPLQIADVTKHTGEAFREILPWALMGGVVLIILHLGLCVVRRRPAAVRARGNWWERLVYLGLLASVVVLGVTAFVGMLRYEALAGWLLFVHMFGAGLFVGVLPVLALTWCGANRFECRRSCEGEPAPASRFFWCPKVMFWIILASGLVVTATMLFSMLPLMGTAGLEWLLDLHRYSGLIVVLATGFHLYGWLLQGVKLR
jgi:hypothetical protein